MLSKNYIEGNLIFDRNKNTIKRKYTYKALMFKQFSCAFSSIRPNFLNLHKKFKDMIF